MLNIQLSDWIKELEQVKKLTLTRGELERNISQDVIRFYVQQLGHTPDKVSCQICDNKLIIILDDSITLAEKVLIQEGESELAEEVRSKLDEAIQEPLKQLIENLIGINVVDLFSDATLETTRTGIIAVLSESPSFRQNSSTEKTKSRKTSLQK